MTDKALTSASLTPAREPARASQRDFKAYLPWITTPALCLLLVAVWWIYIDVSKISAFILPTPASVGEAWVGLLMSKRAWIDTAMTVYATLLGFLWAMIAGVGHRRLDRAGALARANAQSVYRRKPGIAEGGSGAAVRRLVRFRRHLEGPDRGDARVLSHPHQHRAGREIHRPRLRRRDGKPERDALAGVSPARTPLLAPVHHHGDGSRHRAGADRRDRRRICRRRPADWATCWSRA